MPELDRLKLSDKPAGATPEEGKVTLGQLATKATHWLLDTNRRRRQTGHGVVRCQKWIERLDEKVCDLTSSPEATLRPARQTRRQDPRLLPVLPSSK